MHCPACNNQLSQMIVSNIQVDACNGGCGGIWFDRFELKKFDEPNEEAGLPLLDLKTHPQLSVDSNKRRQCPKCDDSILMRRFFSAKLRVQVDVCPSCAGTWLDIGELRSIRSESPSEAARRQAAEECFAEMFGKEISELRSKTKEESARVRRIVNMFRFICPSYYIPGKQSWGAF
jgi:uncharacterized protein